MLYGKFVSAAAVFLLLVGCVPVPSLNPFYLEQQLVFDPALVGSWKAEEDAAIVFSQLDGRSYLVTLPTEDRSYQLRGRLFRIADAQFLDLSPVLEDSEAAEELVLIQHLMPIHSVHRIRVEGDKMTFASLDDEWIEKKLKSGELRIQHSIVDESVLLTASTEELQALLRRYASDAEAFPHPETFQRAP